MSKRGRPKKQSPTKKTSSKWTSEEDEKLREAVNNSEKPYNWDIISQNFPNKTKNKCEQRWNKILNPTLKKGPWSMEEDEKIMTLVEKYGAKKWSFIAQHLNGRVGKQCRERYNKQI